MKHIVCPHCGALNRIPEGRLEDDPRCGSCHRPLLEGQPVDLTKDTFTRQIARNDIPVVVDFWAPWCGPCRIMAPAFAQAAGALRSRARFARVNTEQEQVLAGQYAIRSIPTLVLFKNGREADRMSGALDATRLRQWIEQRL
ncbi:MAG: thioredoxin TrxC [Acidiferrobacteraceae bacterium]